ncbi:MAG TPA: thioredoxin domain-containing protein [Actinomycetota bacterium]
MTPTNRLAGASSPYLLQHAGNPVDWYPWGDEAFERARTEDKPVFLSVGYAACHWCHVMERESFEDEATATLLNERFVSIKVDREERPDIDRIYMDAVQAMTGQGGWPMSVWLTPDGRPFFAGTYFPDEPRHGLPSFRRVLEGLAEAWATRRDEIEAQSGRVTEAIAGAGLLSGSDEPLGEAVTDAAMTGLRRSFDPRWGGFGGAPKFPQPMVLEFLLRAARRGIPDALEMVVLTLERMADGGMHDQVGGGFARYATDAAWHVPHFEKMLYDNAQLARVFTNAWLLTRNERFRTVAETTLDYLLRELRQDEGGFSSSQDADSEGVEGRFFTWSWDDLRSLAGEAVAEALGATPEGNWLGEDGRTNVLWRPVPVAAVAAAHDLGPGDLVEQVEAAIPVLFAARDRRVHPGTDDKVLTAWNALAIDALARAGRAFDRPSFVEAAVVCGSFLWDRLRDAEGRLLRSWRAGAGTTLGFADDHALLADAFLTLHAATGEVAWFVRARELADGLLARFADPELGGFLQTANDAERLVVRPRDAEDNATPSGNSAAALTLLRLALLTGDAAYERAAVGALRLVRDAMQRYPTGFGQALCALDLLIGPAREVAVIGALGDRATRELVDEVLRARFVPNAVLSVAEPDDAAALAAVPLLRDRVAVDGRPTAYVCERFACRLPVTDPAALGADLEGVAPDRR